MAVIYDMKTYRIPNKLNIVGCMAGMLLSIIAYGFKGLLYSLTGMVIPVALLFIFYCFGAVGAGDIKLLSMIGSFIFKDILYVIVFSFILISLFGILTISRTIICLVIEKKKLSAVCFRKIHMSIPIAFGTMLYMFISA